MSKRYTVQTQHSNNISDVVKHLNQHRSEFKRPIAEHQRILFERIKQHTLWQHGIHIDWGCGTGMSTLNLAQNKPQQLVVGIDQSKHRLMKHARFGTQIEKQGWAQYQNCMLVHGRIEDMALLFFEYSLQEQNTCVQAQTFFYPNPWPKRKHLNKRLPTHPIFPYLASLSNHIIMRCNWKTYAEQWCFCAQHFKPDLQHVMTLYTPNHPISLFERKYLQTNTPIFQVVSQNNVLIAGC